MVLSEVARVLFVEYRQRSLVALALMVAQAFFYNAIFFTYALVLGRFYVSPAIAWRFTSFPLHSAMSWAQCCLGRSSTASGDGA